MGSFSLWCYVFVEMGWIAFDQFKLVVFQQLMLRYVGATQNLSVVYGVDLVDTRTEDTV